MKRHASERVGGRYSTSWRTETLYKSKEESRAMIAISAVLEAAAQAEDGRPVAQARRWPGEGDRPLSQATTRQMIM